MILEGICTMHSIYVLMQKWGERIKYISIAINNINHTNASL